MARQPASLNAARFKQFAQNFDKTFGEGRLIVSEDVNPYKVIPTGSLVLDEVLGVGGIPLGRIHEIWGPEGVGKTTLALILLAMAAKAYPDRGTFFVDMEGRLDKPWAIENGVVFGLGPGKCHIFEPDTAEEVADAIKEFNRSALFSLGVLDSVASMIPKAEMEKDSDEEVVAKQAKIVTRMVKINAVECRKNEAALLLINQVRANISSYGADTTTGGGHGLKHSSTIKLRVRRTGTSPHTINIDGEKRIVGHEIAVYTERNSVAPAYRTATINLFTVPTEKYGPIGIDRADEAFTLGTKYGFIETAGGGYYTLPVTGERIRGREAAVDVLRKDPAIIEHIREQVIARKASEVLDDSALIDVSEEESEPTPTGKKGKDEAKKATHAFKRGSGHVPNAADG